MSDTNVSILWEAVDYIRVEEIKKAFPQVNFVDVSPGVELDQELRGKIFLVTVDFRPKSKTFLQYQSFNLSSKFLAGIFAQKFLCHLSNLLKYASYIYKIAIKILNS